MTTPKATPGNKEAQPVKPEAQPAKELKTEYPLSEKDEVKKAEQQTNKGNKKP